MDHGDSINAAEPVRQLQAEPLRDPNTTLTVDELREFVRLQALDVSLALDYFSEEGQNYRYLSGMIENYLWFYAEGDDAWLDSVTYANKTIKELEEAAAIASTEELKPTNEELLLLEELYYTEWAALDPSKKADYRYVV